MIQAGKMFHGASQLEYSILSFALLVKAGLSFQIGRTIDYMVQTLGGYEPGKFTSHMTP